MIREWQISVLAAAERARREERERLEFTQAASVLRMSGRPLGIEVDVVRVGELPSRGFRRMSEGELRTWAGGLRFGTPAEHALYRLERLGGATYWVRGELPGQKAY